MSKHFRPWKIDEAQLLPPSVQDYVANDHLSRLVVSLVRESLDLSEITGSYPSGLGQPPFDPRMMTALLLHGYASGVAGLRRPKPPMRRRTSSTAPSAATRCPIGWPTGRSGWRKSAKPRRRWRRKPRPPPKRRCGAAPRRKRSGGQKVARRAEGRRLRRARSPTARRSATSPIRTAAS